MSDESAVFGECNAKAGVSEISDACARTIASWYQHPGMTEESARFVARGEICTPADDVYRGLISSEDYNYASPAHKRALDMFGTYLLNREDRGPIEGWSSMWVR